MTTRRTFMAAAAASPLSSQAFGFLSPKVGVGEFFDPQYYANWNSDVVAAGLKTYAQIRGHWLSHGINEGRMAHPEFHAPSYRARYADLRAAFGTNLAAYYQHWLSHGQYEGRIGRPSGVLVARLGDVSIGASARCAGAVESLCFSGADSLNSYDHGRQLQTACYDTRYEGCYNPTQAGGMTDHLGPTSSSQLLYGAASGSVLHTRTRASFWTRPGETITAQGMYGCTAHNTTVLSDFVADTKYTLRQRNGVTIIDYDLIWTIGTHIPAGHFMAELTTGYHTTDFSVGYEIVPEQNYAARLRHMGDHLTQPGQERQYPTILTTPDGSRAVGVYSANVDGAATKYATWLWRFGQNQETNDCSKWTIVRRYAAAMTPGQQVPARCYIVLGQVTAVHQELIRLMRGI